MYLKGSGYMGFDGSLSFDTKIDEKGLTKGFTNVNKKPLVDFHNSVILQNADWLQ